MADRKLTLALVAHDQKKDDMVAFVGDHAETLGRCRLLATGTTGGRILEAFPDLDLTRLRSGPLGGDQQIGSMIADGDIDGLIFLVDPLTAMPHDVDVKALLRLAIVYDVPMALNRSTADRLLQSFKRLSHGEPNA